jgi:hypothetical protein
MVAAVVMEVVVVTTIGGVGGGPLRRPVTTKWATLPWRS